MTSPGPLSDASFFRVSAELTRSLLVRLIAEGLQNRYTRENQVPSWQPVDAADQNWIRWMEGSKNEINDWFASNPRQPRWFRRTLTGWEVDIANTPQDYLPWEWQQRNVLAAGNVLRRLLNRSISTPVDLTFMQRLYAATRGDWLAGDARRARSDQRGTFGEIPPDQQRLDVNVVHEGLDQLNRFLLIVAHQLDVSSPVPEHVSDDEMRVASLVASDLLIAMISERYAAVESVTPYEELAPYVQELFVTELQNEAIVVIRSYVSGDGLGGPSIWQDQITTAVVCKVLQAWLDQTANFTPGLVPLRAERGLSPTVESIEAAHQAYVQGEQPLAAAASGQGADPGAAPASGVAG